MLNPVLLVPAYGKTYKTTADMRAAWEKGVDFMGHHSGQYCSVRDLDALSYMTSTITIVDPRSSISIDIPKSDAWAHVPSKRGSR